MSDNELENFRMAVKEDEYAEYDLGDGFTLVTDWEGDGYFNPHVVPPEDVDNPEDLEDKVSDMTADIIRVGHIEWSDNNGVYHFGGASLI